MVRLLLVRHARAGGRGTGPSDLDRPLDGRGLAQAQELAGLLRPLLATGGTPAEVRSSPARRCIETVDPLARSLGTAIIRDDGLLEGSDVTVLHARIASLERPTVWASHGDVIPALLTMLAHRGVDLGPHPTCRKASTWVLDIVGGEVEVARHLPPPD